MNYLNILDCSVIDGEGVRVALFVSGCSHHCPGCHNPESWDPQAGKQFTKETENELIQLLSRSFIKGITLTGGDPLFCDNRKVLTKFCKTLKEQLPEKNIWCYTGFLWEAVKDLEIMNYIDVLVDGPFIESEKDLQLAFRGSKNQRIIDVQKSKIAEKIILRK